MKSKQDANSLEERQREEAEDLARRLLTARELTTVLEDFPSQSLSLGLFLVLFFAYGALGSWLILEHHYIFQDGISRVANGSYVLFSRTPHLAAVGFVWNPLPSVVELPLIALKYVWQPLLSMGIAGVVMSAAFMAGSVLQLRGILLDRGLSRTWRGFLTFAFAAHPMIIIYGGNAMSEAPFLFFTIWAVRRLIRWIYTDSVGDLAVAGIALGLCYMTRYEALMLGAGAMGSVLAIRAWRDREHGWKVAVPRGALDAAVLGFPLLISFLFWTLASWVITGNALAQFSSVYGNAAQTATSALATQGSWSGFVATSGGPTLFVLRSLLSLEPLCVGVALAAIAVALWRRERVVIPVLSMFGVLVLFELYGAQSGTLFPWLRYVILVIPVTIILLATILPPERIPPSGSRRRPASLRSHFTPRSLKTLYGLFVALCLVPSFPVSFWGITNPNIGNQEAGLRSILWPGTYPPDKEAQLAGWEPERQLAEYLDSLGLKRGAVLVDTWLGWPIVISSKQPTSFVITSDFDFTRDLNAPTVYGVTYFLVPKPQDAGVLDAVNRRYHTLFRDGGGFASLALDIPSIGSQPEWRLYRIDSNPLDAP